MCLSKVYKGEATQENLILENVQKIECQDGTVFLTDIMERRVAVEGDIIMADLVGGRVILQEKIAG